MLELQSIDKSYAGLRVLKNLDFALEKGDSVAIVGPSGSGKSTFLALACGLDVPDSGQVYLNGSILNKMSVPERTAFRPLYLGIVFQHFHLLEHLSALQNVSLAREILNLPKAEERAIELLEAVGLKDRLHHRPSQLSGGENQRVAIARALCTEPAILLADEPTGNLDPETASLIADLLFRISKDSGTGLILVTHNMELSRHCNRQMLLQNGRLQII